MGGTCYARKRECRALGLTCSQEWLSGEGVAAGQAERKLQLAR